MAKKKEIANAQMRAYPSTRRRFHIKRAALGMTLPKYLDYISKQ